MASMHDRAEAVVTVVLMVRAVDCLARECPSW